MNLNVKMFLGIIVSIFLATIAFSQAFTDTDMLTVGLEETTSDVIVPIRYDSQPCTHAVEGKEIKNAFKGVVAPANIPVVNSEEDEFHPTIAAGGATYLVGYTYAPSIIERYVYMATSSDGGSTYEYAGYWNLDELADYPSFDYWGGNTFKGTFMPDPNTGTQYLIEIEDINDYEEDP